MSETAVFDTRNIVLLGHTGSGKTTLVDALAYKMGINDRLGSVDDGTSVSDYTDEERERKTSIYCSTFNAEHNANGSVTHIFYTDTPGYADFYGQGSFTMEYSRYDVVPPNLTAKIVAEAEKHEED